jgi:hypothetical protein
MGVTPGRDPGPGKTDGGVGKTETDKSNPKKGKVIRLVPPGKEAAPQECVWSQAQDRANEKDCRSYDLQPVKGKEWLLCSRGMRGNAESRKKQVENSSF